MIGIGEIAEKKVERRGGGNRGRERRREEEKEEEEEEGGGVCRLSWRIGDLFKGCRIDKRNDEESSFLIRCFLISFGALHFPPNESLKQNSI